jgi:hypothetical protein
MVDGLPFGIQNIAKLKYVLFVMPNYQEKTNPMTIRVIINWAQEMEQFGIPVLVYVRFVNDHGSVMVPANTTL